MALSAFDFTLPHLWLFFRMSHYNLNRFHYLVLFTWQFAIFFAVQQIFPIFLVYVPEWKCSGESSTNTSIPETWKVYSRKCEVYEKCPKNDLEINDVFQSAAIEFGWICTGIIFGTLKN